MAFFENVFSHVCGSTNVWALADVVLPFCQRCTGLYVGGFAALGAYLTFRPRPTPRFLWLHGVLLVGMVPFGYHWVSQNGFVRTTTGFLFACGVVYYLLLLPFARWSRVQRENQTTLVAYLLTALVTLLLAVSFGEASLAKVIATLGFLGLVAFVVLMSVSAWCLVRA